MATTSGFTGFQQSNTTGAFPGSDTSDVGLWTNKNLEKIPVLTQRGNPLTTTLGNVIPVLGQLNQVVGGADQYESMLDAVSRYGEFDDKELAELQPILTASGIVSGKNPTDEDYFKGYRQIVEQAARHHQTVGEVLSGLVDQIKKTGGAGGRERAPLTIQLTNPTDIHLVANKVGQSLLGRNLTDQELAQITSSFQGQESASQRAAYNTGAGGGTSTQAPSLQSFAEQQLRSANPTETGAHDIANTLDTFFGLLKGGQ